MKKSFATILGIIFLLAGCSSAVQTHEVVLGNGQKATYVTGKVAGDGQEGVFRDAFIDGLPVLSHFGSGQSLTGQVLQGAAAAALIGGGMVGAAAVTRPTRINETNNLANEQDQGQLQGQSTSNKLSNTSVNVNANKSSSYSKGGNASAKGGSSVAVSGSHAEGGKAYGGSASNHSCIGIGSC